MKTEECPPGLAALKWQGQSQVGTNACMRWGQSRDFSRFEERPERGWAVCAFSLSERGPGKARKGMPESILS